MHRERVCEVRYGEPQRRERRSTLLPYTWRIHIGEAAHSRCLRGWRATRWYLVARLSLSLSAVFPHTLLSLCFALSCASSILSCMPEAPSQAVFIHLTSFHATLFTLTLRALVEGRKSWQSWNDVEHITTTRRWWTMNSLNAFYVSLT